MIVQGGALFPSLSTSLQAPLVTLNSCCHFHRDLSSFAFRPARVSSPRCKRGQCRGGSIPRRTDADQDGGNNRSSSSSSSGSGALVNGLFVGGFVGGLVFGLSALLQLPLRYAWIAFGLQWSFFLLDGWPRRSEKLYDASGSLTHLCLVLAALTESPSRSPRQIVVSVLAVVWCTRLGTFLFNRIARDAKDDRFTKLKTNFWSFSIAWNLQVAWVFLLQLPIFIANSEHVQPVLGLLDAVGLLMWSIGFLVESVADAEKFAFRSDLVNRGRYITTGLWRYSRHPNYFGEILMWMGICVSCSSVFSGWRWLGWLSPLFNAFLLRCVSGVPMLETAGHEKWGSDPKYRHYMERTSCILLWKPAPPYCEPGSRTHS